MRAGALREIISLLRDDDEVNLAGAEGLAVEAIELQFSEGEPAIILLGVNGHDVRIEVMK